MQKEPTKTNYDDSPKTYREAKEVCLLMQRDVRISRNVRAAWFFEHLEKFISLDKSNQPENDYQGISVVGITPKDGEPVEKDEILLVTTSTTITYFSKLYRFIFVLDFSPSSFVSDENDEAVLYTKLIESVVKCVKNLVKEFKFPGGQEIFQPQLLASFCAFTPFLCFSKDSVLLQGVLLNEETVQNILDFLNIKIKNYLNKLCIFAQPHMKKWNIKRRKRRKSNVDVLSGLSQQNSSFSEDISLLQQKPLSSTYNSKINGQALTDNGFIQPDWALIFMLRMGLMGVQMLPENTQSNVVILTDGVCGIPDSQALQNILTQIRNFTIAVSFIQLRQSSLSGPVLGHVGFPQLFHFLSSATFGRFLKEDQLEQHNKNSLEYNIYHKSFLSWSFQLALLKSNVMPDSAPIFPSYTRNRKLSRSYEANIYQLLYVRLREGYILKQVDIQKRSQDVEIITAKMLLAWKPNINIEYVITSPWSPQNRTGKKCKIHVDVFVDTVLSGSDIFGERDADSIKSAILSLNQDDCLLMHLHLFNCDIHYCSLPKEFDKKMALFEYCKNYQKPVLIEKYENLKNSKFVSIWQPLCLLDDSTWHKLFHTHTMRLCLTHDLPLPDKIFTPSLNKGRFPQITSEVAFHVLHQLLRSQSTFTLVKDHLYISWEEKENPSYFYLIKASLEMPFVIIKLGFLGGVSGITRNKICKNLKSLLEKLTIKREVQYVNSMEATSTSFYSYNSSFHQSFTKTLDSKLLTVLRKPMEKILARYRSIPLLLEQIIRLEKSENLQDNREMILHNAITKYMCTRRQIWHLRGVFIKSSMPSSSATRSHMANAEVACMEFILQTLLRRRLNQGFSIAYGRNGIVNLTRQREDECNLPRVEQCVIFSPLMDNKSSNWRSFMHLRQQSIKYGYEPYVSNLSTLKSNNGLYPDKESSISVTWPQLMVEIWSEPQSNIKQQDINGDFIRTQLLAENDSLIRTLFTFEQWIKVCNSKIWIEKPFVLPDEGMEAVKLSAAVDCYLDTFNFKTMLLNATEKELMLLPALGYSNGDPHSNTRLSILLKSVKRELVETCDACVEVSDLPFLEDIISFLLTHFQCSSQVQEQESQITVQQPTTNDDTTPAPHMVHSFSASNTDPSKASVISCAPASPLFSPIQRCVSSSLSSDNSSPLNFQVQAPKPIVPAPTTWLTHDQSEQLHYNITLQELLGERRSTSVPLLPVDKATKKAVESTKTLGVTDGHHPEFASAFNMPTAGSQPISGEGGQEIKKKYSPTAFSNDELCCPAKGPPPTKKCSAPPSSLNKEPGRESTTAGDTGKYEHGGNHRLAGVGVRIYAKRLNDYRMVLFVVPNDARSVNALMPADHFHCFPVLAYHCDRAKMAQWLAESTDILAQECRKEVVVESFCHKAEASTLAQLSRQVSRRAKDYSKSEESMESFYVVGGESRVEQREQLQPIHTAFYLSKYCEEFFEEYVFTRAFIATIYVCLGQEIFVPSPVLLEAVDYRCEHLNIEIGSINEILNDTCVHMKQKNKREPRKPRHQRLFSSSSSSSSSCSTLDGPPVCEHGLSTAQKNKLDSENISFKCDTEDQLMKKTGSNSGSLSTSTDDETACEDELNDFRNSFDNLLKSHNFVKVPGLKDESYFFYWPQTHSADMNAQLASFDDFSEDLPTVLSPCNNTAVGSMAGQKSNFSRNNSTKNTIASSSSRIINVSRGGRKTSASTISMRRSTNASEIYSNVNDDEIKSILTRQSSCESWDGCSDNDESEKSSLAEEFLLGTDKWPLFIQFSVAVHVNEKMETFSVEFIPNCLKDILEKCAQMMLPKQEDKDLSIFISIDMYVLSWPLRSPELDGETESLDGEFNTSGGDKQKRGGHYSIMHTADEDQDDIFEQPVERLRQLPVQEHRTLRRLQRNIQRMLKIEHILIMSRDFDKKRTNGSAQGVSAQEVQQNYKALRRVIRFITEEIRHTKTIQSETQWEQTDRRFEMVSKELSLVAEPVEGLNRLCDRLSKLKIDYCSLKRFSAISSTDTCSAKSNNCCAYQNCNQKVNQSPRSFKRNHKEPLIFYSCGVDDVEAFTKSRHESTIVHSKKNSQNRRFSHLKDEFGMESQKKILQKTSRQASNISFQDDGFIVDIEGSQQCCKRDTKKHSFERLSETSSEDTSPFVKQEDEMSMTSEQDDADNETISNVTELTMPLNDCDFDPLAKSLNARLKSAFTSKMPTSLLERPCGTPKKHLLHDFWLIIVLDKNEDDSSTLINIYFCQRSPLIHSQLFGNACKLVDKQIKLVNQMLLLEKMHRTEEADQLLVVDNNDNLCFPSNQHSLDTSHSSRDINSSVDQVLSKHAAKFAHRPTSFSVGAQSRRTGLLGLNDEDRNKNDNNEELLGEMVRYKFSPGFFACDMVWHCWFAIHPRLQPSRPFSASDVGFQALRLGLEGLAVRNRSNMYVYRERTGNIIYMRLHSSEESVYANISTKSNEWQEEVAHNISSCILLSVHGIHPPGEEISVQLKNVLSRRLNLRTLDEIQNALLKNAHIRLEWHDIKFIQQDPQQPCETYFFTVPSLLLDYLGSLQYYLGQQLSTFCILPKFREQSGVHQQIHKHHHQLVLSLNLGDGTALSTFMSTNGEDSMKGATSSKTVPSTPPAHQFSSTFLPYSDPRMPPNPQNYCPVFYLVNKPPGKGKGDTGIAVLEVKLIDWQGNVFESVKEGHINNTSHSLLYPSLPNGDRMHRASRLHELTKCVQVSNLFDGNPVAGTSALFQFNMWKNGNVGMDELQSKLKMCVQQAIFDLVTEFGLLSTAIFETSEIRSTTSSFSTNFELRTPQLHRQNAQDSIKSEQLQSKRLFFSGEPLSTPASTLFNAIATNTQPRSGRFSTQPEPQSPFHTQNAQPNYLQNTASTSALPSTLMSTNSSNNLLHSCLKPSNKAMAGSAFELDGQQQVAAPQMSVPRAQPSRPGGIHLTLVGGEAPHPSGHPSPMYPIYQYQMGKISPTTSTPPATSSSLPPLILPVAPSLNTNVVRPLPMTAATAANVGSGVDKEQTPTVNEYLRGDFVAASDEWFNHVTNEAKGLPEMSHSIRKFQFNLDCDGSAKKIIQVIYARLKALLKGEKVVICRSSVVEGTSYNSKRLQTLLSITSLLSYVEKDYGRVVNVSATENMDLVLLAYNEQQCLDTLRFGSGQEPGLSLPASLVKLADVEQNTYSKFLPSLKPFIPRQRLLYLIMRGENSTCYLYNYTNEVVVKTKEIVERAILWHNARSRLLREIGLHKMGITHLSTLGAQVNSAKNQDSKFNSYLLLTWMDPETLVRNDYPIDNLTTPDFSKIPRLYAQLLLKLYRFSNPAFVAKNLSESPFDDQTEQMLALREDVRAMLNDHRLFQEIHKKLVAGDTILAEENFARIIHRSHQDHFVQSPILLFPNWRRRVGAIRTGADWAASCCKHSYPSINQLSTTRTSPKIRSKTINASLLVGGAAVNFRSLDEELLLRIQHMLMEDYVKYLQHKLIGLTLIKLERPREPSNVIPQSCHSSPNVWLYLSLPGGVIFVQCYFCEPYFCVRFLQWNNNTHLNEYIRPNSQITKEETEHLRTLNRTKNDLIQKCHVHSFTYDFHLRIVARYLLGGTQVLFNSGYNTNAFLIDFLQYYGCRPPFARNCIYEESINCSRLQVGHGNIWEFFLDYSEQHFGLKVIRLKNMDQANCSDEFMLVSKDKKELFFKQPYKFVTVVLNNAKPGSYKEHQISMKFYVILVTEDNAHPILDMVEENEKCDTGEFKRVSPSAEESGFSTLIGGAGGDQLTPFVESETDEEDQLEKHLPPCHIQLFQPKPSLSSRMERMLSNSKGAHEGHYTSQHNYCLQCNSEAIESSAPGFEETGNTNRRRFRSGGNIRSSCEPRFWAAATASNRNSPTLGSGGRRSSETPAVSFLVSAASGYTLPTNIQQNLENNLQKTESSSMFESLDQVVIDEVAGQRQLATSKVPPRRHRKASTSRDCPLRESMALVPPEQVTYLHYFSSHQRKLQQLLEDTVRNKKEELCRFILEADRLCYVDMLWKTLLSSKSSHIRKQQPVSFMAPSNSKMDILADSNVLKSAASPEMEPADFDSLLRIIRMVPMVEEEPKLKKMLVGVNFASLSKFLIQYYEGERRCRYFNNGPRTYLIITNPSFLDSAVMFSNCCKLGIEVFFLFKNTDGCSKMEQDPFAAMAIHKQFEDVMSSMCAYLWADLHNTTATVTAGSLA